MWAKEADQQDESKGVGITVGKGDEEEQSRDLIQGGSSKVPERPMEVPMGDVVPKEESAEAPLSP